MVLSYILKMYQLTEVFRDDFLAVVHDEHPSDVQLDVVLVLPVLEQVEWGAFWHEQEGAELQLSFNWEVLLEKFLISNILFLFF